MKCPNCNTKNIDDALFCKICGLDLREIQTRENNVANIELQSSDTIVQGIDEALISILMGLEKLRKCWDEMKGKTECVSVETYERQIMELEKEKEQNRKLIESQQKQLEDMKKQLGDIYMCPRCKKKYREKVMFCSECGTKMSEE